MTFQMTSRFIIEIYLLVITKAYNFWAKLSSFAYQINQIYVTVSLLTCNVISSRAIITE